MPLHPQGVEGPWAGVRLPAHHKGGSRARQHHALNNGFTITVCKLFTAAEGTGDGSIRCGAVRTHKIARGKLLAVDRVASAYRFRWHLLSTIFFESR